MLHNIQVKAIPLDATINTHLANLFEDWNARNELFQSSFVTFKPILSIRRILLNEMKTLLQKACASQPRLAHLITETIDHNIGALWKLSTEYASNSKLYQQAHLYIMNAETYKPKDLFIQKAQLYWDMGDQANAFKVLDVGINDMLQAVGGVTAQLTNADRRILGQAQLMVNDYNVQSMNVSAESLDRGFIQALLTYPEYEKGYVVFAQYLERCYDVMPPQEQQSDQGAEKLLSVMKNYGRSLQYGCNKIYQSMPRMLTIWLDNSTRRDEVGYRLTVKANTLMTKLVDVLPLFTFFSAFSQLVSRICHPNSDVFSILTTIMVKLILTYPQQSLWRLMAVSKSFYPMREKRCNQILNDRRLSKQLKLISNFQQLTERLIRLTDTPVAHATKTTVEKLTPDLVSFFKTVKQSTILMPIQKQMQLLLPLQRDRDRPGGGHNPFPDQSVYITGLNNDVLVLGSLARPKRISLKGSDGKDYMMLLKPKDDLRKDYRMMEFNNVIKQFLYEDLEARQRRLNITTYFVLPLNDECGIIEWVHNITTFRAVMLNLYRDYGKGINSKELQKCWPALKDKLETKRAFFQKIVARSFPPLLKEWFKNEFPSPYNWYQARTAYIKSLAVMSIVGYIVGLGDRHGENVLINTNSGDVIHVDFNCLFNRGESFEWPELVPFRLTDNMIKAMGPLGVEGLFRRCCEITMRIMRTEQTSLLSILRPFVYDPLVSWNRQTKQLAHAAQQQEQTDSNATQSVEEIERRLKGYVKIKGKKTQLPLSVEGQVSHCIAEATDIDNLARMFIGWGAYQ